LLAQKVLEMSGRSRLMMTLMILAAAVTVALDAALVPVMGPNGAAFALASGAAFYTFGCLRWGRRVLRDHRPADPRPLPRVATR
jgi:Na+-driven multidrug efflux pump